MKAYSVESSVYYKGHQKITLAEEVYNEICAAGPIDSSFNVLASRLMNLPYDEFLQLIKQDYGAVLHHRVGKYISYSFPDPEKAKLLVTELNKRWNYLMFVKNGKPEII